MKLTADLARSLPIQRASPQLQPLEGAKSSELYVIPQKVACAVRSLLSWRSPTNAETPLARHSFTQKHCIRRVAPARKAAGPKGGRDEPRAQPMSHSSSPPHRPPPP